LKSIAICSVLFGLWHLPAYFSVYAGGAAVRGWGSVALMLLVHGVSSIPVCVLYLTTRELYSVSLYHALVDVFQYAIIGNPAWGVASEKAVYSKTVLNAPVMEVVEWAWLVLSIPIMVGLCRIVRRLLAATAHGSS
jgi:hypothetical protein